MVILDNRTIIEISGSQKRSFLQGLLTNDINKVDENNAIYAMMLSPQGRFLYDFFIIKYQDSLLLDCNVDKCDEIIKKLSLYKLRADVEIKKMEEDFMVIAAIDEDEIKNISLNKNIIHFSDPRNSKMGLRIITDTKELAKFPVNGDLNSYNEYRLNLRIADDSDLTHNQSLILEYGFDNLNAVDYQKGCYIGQEVTARTHYRGLIRKKIYLVEIEGTKKIQKGSEITCDNKKIGIVLSSVFSNNKLKALALIKNIDNQNQEIDLQNSDLKLNENKVTLIT